MNRGMIESDALSALGRIFAPQVTGVPPVNPHRDFMMLPDGELRHYGCKVSVSNGKPAVSIIVKKSNDYGLNWREETVHDPTPGASVRDPWSGDYITILHNHAEARRSTYALQLDDYYSIFDDSASDGVYVCRSKNGPDGPFSITKISDDHLHIQRQPLPLKKRRRWIQVFQEWREGFLHPGVLISDDGCISWKKLLLPYPPLHEIHWPHKGYRWRQPGSEPVVAECPSGKLIMLLRTSQDQHYEAFSEDGGETWTAPAPGRFYSVATMPNLVTLSDGRMLAVWNNTAPLPEMDHALQPGLSDDEIKGKWEDVFTNRDAIHCAISEDEGKTWIGFREIHLNECRNDSDFRSSGGTYESLDKSIHQNEVIELPGNKVIAAFGQHFKCRRFVIFDIRWLYEKSRRDDFSKGLENWSVQQYLKSISGGFRGIAGHCSFNRRAGASLVPHPDGLCREVLQIARHPDIRLLEEKQGAVWNFPAGFKGELEIRLRLQRGSAGMTVCLTDRWFNPVDPVVRDFSQYVLDIDSAGRINAIPSLKSDKWATLSVRWNIAGTAEFSLDNTGEWHRIEYAFSSAVGISYLHMQSNAMNTDTEGVLIESVEVNLL